MIVSREVDNKLGARGQRLRPRQLFAAHGHHDTGPARKPRGGKLGEDVVPDHDDSRGRPPPPRLCRRRRHVRVVTSRDSPAEVVEELGITGEQEWRRRLRHGPRVERGRRDGQSAYPLVGTTRRKTSLWTRIGRTRPRSRRSLLSAAAQARVARPTIEA